MTSSRAERIAKSNAARQRRKELKNIMFDTTTRLYSKLRKLRKKSSKRNTQS